MFKKEFKLKRADYFIFRECNGALIYNKIIVKWCKVVLSGGFFALRDNDPIYLQDKASVDIILTPLASLVFCALASLDKNIFMKALMKYIKFNKHQRENSVFRDLVRDGTFLGYYNFTDKSDKNSEYIYACGIYDILDFYRDKKNELPKTDFHKVTEKGKMTFSLRN